MALWDIFTRRSEQRSESVDAGALYASFFALGAAGSYSWTVSPAVLAAAIAQDGFRALLEHSRRLGKQSPLLISYRRCMAGGVLTGDAEPPEFPDTVPDEAARIAAGLWMAAHPCELERDALHRLIVDGDCLILDGVDLVPAEAFEVSYTRMLVTR